MHPSASDAGRQGDRNRLTDPADVDFALDALLGSAGRDAMFRAALAARLPSAPTVAELVGAIYGNPARAPARLAHRLIEAYFLLDPSIPPSVKASA